MRPRFVASIPEQALEPAFADYMLGTVLGTGLAGEVREARHSTGFDVAIEVIGAPLTDDEGFRQRLADATDEAAVLDHPAIVSVYRTIWDGETAGLVTELVGAPSLSRLRRDTALSPAAICLIADSVLLALAVSHRASVVHGGVCADVVFVDGGRVRLGGFAVGRATRPDHDAEPWTDTHAVAVLVDELAGEAELPRQLQRVVARGTARRIERRYRTASGMRTALAMAARREIGEDWHEVAATELAALAEMPAAPEAPVTAVSRPGVRTAQRVAGLLAAAAVIGVLGGMLASAIRGGGSAATGALSVTRPVSVRLQPAQGACDSVFAATATGHVHGAGTLVYRWERSDGLQTEDTALNVRPDDGTFLITEHWQLDGKIAHPWITFRLVSPVSLAVTRALGYSC